MGWAGKRVGMAVAALVIAVGSVSGCSSGDDGDRSEAPMVSGPMAPATGVPPTFDVPALPSSGPAVGDDVRRVIDHARSDLVLDDDQWDCVGTRLAGRPDLVGALGEEPATSDRWPELTALATSCINTVTYSAAFTDGLREQYGDALSPDQLTCVRREVATWGDDQIRAVTTSGLDPAGSNSPAGDLLAVLRVHCGLGDPPFPISDGGE